MLVYTNTEFLERDEHIFERPSVPPDTFSSLPAVSPRRPQAMPGFSHRIAASFRAGPRVPSLRFCCRRAQKTYTAGKENETVTIMSRGNLTPTTNATKLFEQRVRGRQGKLLLELQKLHFSGAQGLFGTSHAFIPLHFSPDSSLRQFQADKQQIGTQAHTSTSTRACVFAKMHSAFHTRPRVRLDSEQCRERARRQARH